MSVRKATQVRLLSNFITPVPSEKLKIDNNPPGEYIGKNGSWSCVAIKGVGTRDGFFRVWCNVTYSIRKKSMPWFLFSFHGTKFEGNPDALTFFPEKM